MKNRKTLLHGILSLLSLALIIVSCNKYNVGGQNKTDVPTSLPVKIVMLGDSETRRINHYWGPDTNWNTLVNYNNIYNYGFDAYSTQDILNGPVYWAMDENPDVIFLMIGINDAHHNVPLSTTLANIRILIDTIQGRGIDLVMESVMPTTNYYDTLYGGFSSNGILATRARIMSDSIQSICLAKGIDFLDIRLGLITSPITRNGIAYLRNDRSVDGIHLNYSGYQVWANHLVDYLNDNYW